MRVVTLGSRQNTCVNPNVYKLSNITEVNYKCMRIREKSEHGCSFYDANKVKEVSQELYEKITDIEDMSVLGKKKQGCPYYAAKKIAPFTDIICVPYICLLHDKTREQLKIPIKNSVIIIDECHNFMEALHQIYSYSLTYRHLVQTFSQITAYKEKFKKRLKQKTLLYIDQIVRLLNNVMNFLKEKHKNKSSNEQTSHRIIDFLIDLNLDKFDFFKLEAFIQNSQISKKILGYSEKIISTQQNVNKQERAQTNPNSEINMEELRGTKDIATLERFLEFLIALIRSNDTDSKLIISVTDKIIDSTLKIVNLQPSKFINNILNECVSMVFAGGTLEPISEFIPIMDMIGREHIERFSCDHIIPNENFQACKYFY